MTAIITITQHEPGITALATPHTLRDDMGKLEYARYARGIGYLIADEHLDTFRRHANRKGWRIADTKQQPTPTVIEANPLPECVHCATPCRRDNPPRYCPECGNPWQARQHISTTDDRRSKQTCIDCGQTQYGTWPRCSHCGAVMPDKTHTPRPQPQRTQLDEPVPLAQLIADTFPTMGAT